MRVGREARTPKLHTQELTVVPLGPLRGVCKNALTRPSGGPRGTPSNFWGVEVRGWNLEPATPIFHFINLLRTKIENIYQAESTHSLTREWQKKSMEVVDGNRRCGLASVENAEPNMR